MPQKCKLNGFALFAKEQFLDSGEVETMVDAIHKAHGKWDRLSASEQKQYKQRAAALSGPKQSSCPECLRCWKESGAKTATCKDCFLKSVSA